MQEGRDIQWRTHRVTAEAHIILLNGVGSVGKSSIAKALQTIAAAPFLHVEMDAFFAMMPERYWNHPEGVAFEAVEDDGRPSVVIRSGLVAERTFRGMRHAIAAMANAGNNLIVDEVMLGDELAEYRELLADFRFHVVGVFAPLDVLEARERARGDRLIGLARWQYERVHQGKRYDLELDANAATPAECAERIRQHFDL
jgi:chloramphenicol 3-O phosphotransferase